jgi:hypothetical protein
LFTSFSKLLSGTGLNQGNVLKTWQQLSPADQYNLKRIAAGCLVTVAALALSIALEDEDDEKNKKRKNDGVIKHALQSLINDQYFLYQAKSVADAALSPMVALSFISRMGAAIADYASGDFESGNRIVGRNVGIFKTSAWLGDVLFSDDQEKK